MKKYLILSLVLLPLFAFASFDKDLYYGLQKESQVQELQEFLAEQGIYSGPITGNFFSLTLSAVKNFQIANSISPAVGYFGPKTRERANQILTTKGISSTGVTNEFGSTTPVVTVSPKTANDVVASLQDQIKLLQQQLAAIQQQQQTIQIIQQQQASTSQQQTQILGQIQQNTTPLPAPVPIISQPIPQPEVKKRISIAGASNCKINQDKVVTGKCKVEVRYYENDTRMSTPITISSKKGIFYTIDGNNSGNPLTTNPSLNPQDNQPSAYFDYESSPEQIRATITDNACIETGTTTYCGKIISYQWSINPTATANGVTTIGDFTATLHFPYTQ